MLAPPIVTSVTTASSFLPSSSEISELTGLHGGESSAQKRPEGARRVHQDALVVLGHRLINDERRVRRTARIALALQHLAAVGIGVIDAVRGEVSGELHHQP